VAFESGLWEDAGSASGSLLLDAISAFCGAFPAALISLRLLLLLRNGHVFSSAGNPFRPAVKAAQSLALCSISPLRSRVGETPP
jgi:hypothetical protein